MARRSANDDARYVRKETFWLVSLLALAVGFFGGVTFAVLKSDPLDTTAQLPVRAPTTGPADSGRSEMVAALEKETQKNPQNVEAWIELGNLYFDTKQYEKSIRTYRKALELQPDNADVWTDLGVMYRRSGQPQEAIKAFDQAIEVNSRHEVSRLNKGIVLLHDLKDMDGAIKAWEGLLEINPVAMAPTGRSVDEMLQQMKKQQSQIGPGAGN